MNERFFKPGNDYNKYCDYGLREENKVLVLEGLRKCRDCREIKPSADYPSQGKNRVDTRCRVCYNKHKLSYIAEHRQDVKWFCRTACNNVRKRAKSSGIKFDLDADYLTDLMEGQCRACYLSGQYFDFTAKGLSRRQPHDLCPSIDRLIPDLGYVYGNVAWAAFKINTVKNSLTYEEFVNVCYNVVQMHT